MSKLLSAVRRFFGADLPARELPLNFSLPKPSGRFAASKQTPAVWKVHTPGWRL